MTDIRITDHGSICLFHPETAAADTWIHAHVAADAQYFGKAVVVEPRYLGNLIEGAQEDGLTVVVA